MNHSSKPFSLQEGKIQASILLKSLRSTDKDIAQRAVMRFQKLALDIPTEDIQRKHALNVIAIENGFKSWTELKSQLNFIRNGFLNHWFAHYQEAKAYQHAHGGYLLPYKHQFFISQADYIEHIGLNPNDPDWKKIDYDWAKPKDKSAWNRLYKTWINLQGERHV